MVVKVDEDISMLVMIVKYGTDANVVFSRIIEYEIFSERMSNVNLGDYSLFSASFHLFL